MPRPQRLAETASPIHEVISGVMGALETPQRQTVDRAVWQTVVGNTLAAHSAPATLYEGRLTVHVDHPGHLFLLHLQHRDLLRRLQARLGPTAVREVRFRLGTAA